MSVAYRGLVTRVVDGRGVYIQIPHIGGDYEFGPCQFSTDLSFTRGDAIIAINIEDIKDDFVVISKYDVVQSSSGDV